MSPASKLTPPPAAAARGETVVYIVEDDSAVRSALNLLVRCCGWKAQSFESGAEFLQSGVDEAGSCLVLDLNMPDLDGEEVLRRLRARGSQLPVVVITGDRQGSRLERVRRLGASSVLQKPFSDDAFQAAVQNGLATGPVPPDAVG